MKVDGAGSGWASPDLCLHFRCFASTWLPTTSNVPLVFNENTLELWWRKIQALEGLQQCEFYVIPNGDRWENFQVCRTDGSMKAANRVDVLTWTSVRELKFWRQCTGILWWWICLWLLSLSWGRPRPFRGVNMKKTALWAWLGVASEGRCCWFCRQVQLPGSFQVEVSASFLHSIWALVSLFLKLCRVNVDRWFHEATTITFAPEESGNFFWTSEFVARSFEVVVKS